MKQIRHTNYNISDLMGSKFDQLNFTLPSIIKIIDSVEGIGVSNNDRYIVGDFPSGDFLKGDPNDIAVFDDSVGTWVFTEPTVGLEVINRETKTLLRYNGTEWIPVFTFVASEGTVDTDISGNAGSADKWKTPRSFSISGAAIASPVSTDGTANVVLSLTDLNMNQVSSGCLSKTYGGTGRNDGYATGVAVPIKISVSGGLTGISEFTNLISDVDIVISNINADHINLGTVPVARGGTGKNSLSGILKGNGINGILTATAGTDYVVPSGNIGGKSGSTEKFYTAKMITLSGDILGSVSSDFSGITNIVSSYNSIVPIAKGGTGASTAFDAVENIGAAHASHTHSVASITDLPSSLPANGGRADTADKWTYPRTLTLGMGAVGNVSLDGSANVILNVTALNGSKITTGIIPSSALSGTYPISITGNAGSSTVASKVSNVLKLKNSLNETVNYDGSAVTDLTSGIYKSVYSDKLTTGRSISLTGDVNGSGVFDGGSNISIPTTINYTFPYIVSWVMYDSNKTWCKIWSNGWKEQGGLINVTVYGAVLKSYPVAFTSAPLKVHCEPYNQSTTTGDKNYLVTLISITNTSFQLRYFDSDNGENWRKGYVSWEACGF